MLLIMRIGMTGRTGMYYDIKGYMTGERCVKV